MSAEILRKAAALMRERAEAVNEPDMEWWNVDSFAEVTNYEDAEHFVAFGNPTVALAMADMLDAIARDQEQVDSGKVWTSSIFWDMAKHHALTVARAYLGEDQ